MFLVILKELLRKFVEVCHGVEFLRIAQPRRKPARPLDTGIHPREIGHERLVS